MNRETLIAEIEAWESNVRAMELRLQDLKALIGDEHEVPLVADIDRIMAAYTKTVSKHIEDNLGFLATYWVEVINNGTGFMAGSVYVQSTSDLVDVIADNW